MIDYILLAFAILSLIVYVTIIILYNKPIMILEDLREICNLGHSYAEGENRKKSIRRAKKCYRLAAEKGYEEAQVYLGYIYYNSIGKFNKLQAVKWFIMAAEQGNAVANNFLGLCYLYGRGVKMNSKEAVRYFHIGAKMNEAYATHNLGYCYEYGFGLNKDIKKAAKYYEKAVELGHDSEAALLRVKNQLEQQ